MKFGAWSQGGRAAGLVIAVSLLMLGGAALSTIGTAATPASPIEASSPSTAPSQPTVTLPAAAPTTVVHQGETTALTLALPSSGTPPYAWQWLYSANGGSTYRDATSAQCTTPSGSGGRAGSSVTCSFATTDSTPTGTYLFELKVTDSASTPESVTLSAPTTVTVEFSTTTPPAPEAGTGASSSSSGTSTLFIAPVSEAVSSGASGSHPAELGTFTVPIPFGGLSHLRVDPVLDGAANTATCTTACGSPGIWFTLATSPANSGDLLVLVVTDSGESSGPLVTADVSDTAGSTWHLVTPGGNEWNGTGDVQYVFYAFDATSGTDTVTVNTSAASLATATSATSILFALQNAAGVDTSTFATGDSGSATASLTTTHSGETVLGVVSSTTGETFSVDSGYSQIDSTVDDGSGTTTFVESAPAPTVGTYSPSPGLTPSANWGELALAIKGTAAVTFTPSSGDIAGTVTLDGSGFTPGDTVTPIIGGTDYTCSSESTVGSDGSFACPVTVPDVAPGAYSVGASTPDDGTVTASGSFTVFADPTVSVAPTGPFVYDVGQAAVSLTASITYSGSNTHSVEWYGSASSTCSASSTDTGTSGNSFTPSTTTPGTTYFCAVVSDSGVPGYSSPSNAVEVTVDVGLVVPTPTPGSQTVDRGQTGTITGTAPTTGTSPYSYEWLEKAPGASSYSDATDCAAPTTLTCSFVTTGTTTTGTYSFELQVTDSATTPVVADSTPLAVTVNTALAAASAPTVSTPSIDQGQTPIVATDTLPNPLGGTSTVTYTWLVSFDTGTYTPATSTQCGTPSGTASDDEVVNCVVGATVAVGTYLYEVELTDSATTPTSTVSLASGSVTVSAPLATAGAPSVSTGLIDKGQTPVAATDTLPSSLDGSGTVTYTWLVSFDTGPYTPATSTQCATPSGTASDNEVVNCIVGATVDVGTYSYEVELTDAASTPTMTTSDPSGTVTVNSALAAASAPTVSSASIDQGQTLPAVTDTLPNPLSGSGTVTYTWLVSFDAGPYTPATSTQCATPSATAANGEVVSCVVGASVTDGTYVYEVELEDSATSPVTTTSLASGTVTVSPALAAAGSPTVSTSSIDRGQTPVAATATLPTPLDGSGAVTYAWLVSFDSGAYAAATSTQCATPSGTASNGEVVNCVVGATVAVGTYTYEVELTDTASTPETTTSLPSGSVAVNAALSTAVAPTIVTASIDQGETPTVATDTLPNPLDGTGPVTYTWLVSFNAGAYTPATSTQCATPSGTASDDEVVNCVVGATVAVGTYLYEVELADSATTPTETVSLASGTMTVNVGLVVPTPTPGSQTVDRGQTGTITGTAPTTGTSPYSYEWLEKAPGASSYSDATDCAAPTTLTCSFVTTGTTTTGTYSFELQVTDSGTPPLLGDSSFVTVLVNKALTAPSAPTVSATALDDDQTLTVTTSIPSTGSAPYSWQWLISVNGGAYGDATQCAVESGSGANAGATETCTVPGGALTPGTSDSFELEVTDSASGPESQTSSASSGVDVSSALTRPAAPTIESSPLLDQGQTSTLAATIPSTGTGPYAWQWLFSTNGGVNFDPATSSQCTTPSGSGASGGTGVTCSFVTTSSTGTGNYQFELQVTDSASSPETTTSPVSSAVAVGSALVAPGAPTTTETDLDVNQALTVTGKISTTGTALYSWHWLVSLNGGAYVLATECTVDEGSTAPAGATETCSISASTLVVGDLYAFELQVTDGASTPVTVTSVASSTVTVYPVLAAGTPTPASLTIDSGQSLTLTANASGGSGADTYQWYSGRSTSGCRTLSSPISGATSSTYTASPTSTAYYCYTVTDSATTPETEMSLSSTVVLVNSALVAPAAPLVSATTLSTNSALSVTATLPSTGTAPYSWQWIVSVDGGAYSAATQCAVASGSGGAAGAVETCNVTSNTLTAGDTYSFELQVTDSATTPTTQTSTAAPAVTVTAPSSSSSSSSFWTYLLIALAVLVGVLVVILVLTSRRHRPHRPHPASARSQSLEPWEGSRAHPTGGAPTSPAGLASLEAPRVGIQAPAAVVPGTTGGAGTAPAVSTPAAPEPEEDIDTLIARLDKMSVELFKKPSPKMDTEEDAGEADKKASDDAG